MGKLSYLGRLICMERLGRNWSQEGLCSGICSVSYLSKIESGKAEPSEEILELLFARLGIVYSSVSEQRAAKTVDEARERLFTGDYAGLRELLNGEIAAELSLSSRGIEARLLFRIANDRREGLDEEYEKCMDGPSLALQRLLQGRTEEALLLLPNAYCYYESGAAAYSRGEYTAAIEHLNRAYDAAAADGSPKLMLLCKLFLGACFANRRDIESMERHNQAARRLARALGESEAIEQIEYNSAATAIECGQYEEAYSYFSKLSDPNMMSLHKLAIACEKTGRIKEAEAALDKAEHAPCDYPPRDIASLMCALVRYRIEHKNYVNMNDYGKMLLEVFECCKRELNVGYALFHLPWVVEWYKAGRQYKKALELLEDFPQKGR